MISSVRYAMAVIQALADFPKGLSIAEIVRKTGIDKSVVSRIVVTLCGDDYLQKDSRTDSVRLALRLPALALRFLDRTDLLDQCLPTLKGIADHTGELVQLAVAGSGPPVYVATATGPNRVHALPLTGTEAIPHASTVGKLWLASMSERVARSTLGRARLPSVSAKTLTDPDKVLSEIKGIRRLGYSTIQGELSVEINAIAVPIASEPSGQFIGAVCLGAPAHRSDVKALTAHLGVLQEGARTLSPILRRYLFDNRAEAPSSAIKVPTKRLNPASHLPGDDHHQKGRSV
jgi:IclR family acetate operon transcriptional repressor